MKRLVTTALLVSLMADSAAMAAPHWTEDSANDAIDARQDRNRDDRNFRDNDRRGDDRGERRYARDPQPAFRGNDRHWTDRRYRDHFWVYGGRVYARSRYRGGYYETPRGYYRHAWRRGERLPVGFYGRPYVVYGYRNYRLYEPPRGCGWVRVGDDIVLTALATGIVLDAVYNLYY